VNLLISQTKVVCQIFLRFFFAEVIHSGPKAILCQAQQVFHRQVKNVPGTYLLVPGTVFSDFPIKLFV